MKHPILLISACSLVLFSSSCVIDESMLEEAASTDWTPANPASHDYTARSIQGGLVVSDGGREVATIRTAAPNLEEWSFVNGGRNIVTKSRGGHGPATVELWETATGMQRDKVLAFAIQNGQPAWAARYAE